MSNKALSDNLRMVGYLKNIHYNNVSDVPVVFMGWVNNNNIQDISYAEYYLSEKNNNYSKEEIEYVYTEMLRDIISQKILMHYSESKKGHIIFGKLDKMQEEKLSKLDISLFEIKINESNFLSLYYDDDIKVVGKYCPSLHDKKEYINELNTMFSGQKNNFDILHGYNIYRTSVEFLAALFSGQANV